ncbi:MAG: hemolysin family protein [Planctomycetota bacterium]
MPDRLDALAIGRFLIEHELGLTLAFWTTTLFVVFLSIVRRSFLDTPPGHYHAHFNGADSNFDEATKLHRVAVALAFAHHLVRSVWVALYLGSGLARAHAWYLPESVWSEIGVRAGVTLLELFVLSLFFLELVPQVVVAWRGKALALGMLPLLCKFETVVSPLSRGFRAVRALFLRMVGGGAEQSEADLAEEGIRAAVEVGEREGVIQAGEKSMIESVLGFHEAEIIEVMTPRTDMVCFEASLSVSQAIQEAIECGHSRIPVYRDDVDHVIGVLYVKDLLAYGRDDAGGDPAVIPVEKVIRNINFVPETKKIQQLLAEFRAERFHIAVVLDEYGGTSGLVTIEDILEEIVGEIDDEYDEESNDLIRKIGEKTYDLDGRAAIDDFNELTGAEIPESDDYETVAGFLMSSLGKVPSQGDDFEFDSYRFKVVEADERKIKTVRVQVLPAAS